MAEPNQNPAPQPAPQPNPAPASPPSIDPNTVAQLQTQVQQLSQAVQNMGQFVEDSAYVLSTIYQDPNLKTAVQAKFQGNQQPANPQPQPQQPPQQPPQPQNPPTPQTPPQVQSMDVKMREDIIAQIEGKYGYDKLNPEQRKVLRRSVEEKLNAWGTSVLSAPVSELSKTLEDAYLLTDIGKAKEEGRVQGIVEAYTNNMAAIPTIQGQSPQPETTQLSTEQQKWTNRWGLDESKVTERLKEFQDTGVMTYKPKDNQQYSNPTPAPSGTPTPPAPAPAVPPAQPAPQPQNSQ